ncbi:Uncharacterized protein DBV15_05287 [Temnothorax longispinosus]|uniref:Uncharacterized protein n=1 Tax=Temnothorax longispinosus TaxID=300112 RepID=A0A4S2JR94_9HYME|nr:Uncharacterized protein DBV15_05287 [Temnothorax longispinosus]
MYMLTHILYKKKNSKNQEEPYVPTHPVNMALAERYWLSSKGIYIYVNETISPLFIDQNNYRDKHLCLIAKNKAPYQHRDRIELMLHNRCLPESDNCPSARGRKLSG